MSAEKREFKLGSDRLGKILLDVEQRLQRGPPSMGTDPIPDPTKTKLDIERERAKLEEEERWSRRKWIEYTTKFRDAVQEHFILRRTEEGLK